jgi:hypothetical protein
MWGVIVDIGAAITYQFVEQSFSSLGGLPLFHFLIEQLALKRLIDENLPHSKITTKASSFEKLKALVLGFIAGCDCLDDMERLRSEPIFSSLGPVHAPNTYGEFLRSFSQAQVKELNYQLIDFALKLRVKTKGNCEFILDLDSTDHLQHGTRMEGLATNYKNIRGLDSLMAFDQFGFMYWIDVRQGATYTANSSPEVIANVFSRIPHQQRKILRADSGYCIIDVFNAAKTAAADFVIAMKANMYRDLIKTIKNWRPCKQVDFYDGRDCEIGETVYYPTRGRETLRVVMIRAVKTPSDLPLFEQERYDYRAWVTTIGAHEKKAEKIVLFYRKRGAAENFIKEIKYNFDLKHFPCQKLVANKAYGIIAALAYNLMRLAAFLSCDGKKVRFAKHTRLKMIFLPVQVAKTGRRLFIRMNKKLKRELENWKKYILQLGFGTVPIEKKRHAL